MTDTTKDLATKLKCRFCNVKVNRWKKAPHEKLVDGFDTMKEHIFLYHPEEADKMGMRL